MECLALIDSGAQISTITIELIRQWGLKIHQLYRILKFETTGGDIPYMGYVETNLKIPKIKAFDEDILMLVIENSEYAQWVPEQLGTLHFDKILNLVYEKEISHKLNTKWRWSKIASSLTGKMAQIRNETGKDFCHDKVEGTIKLTKTIEIPPFRTKQIQGMTKVKGHNRKVNIIVEPVKNGLNTSIVAVPSYTSLKPGPSKVNVTQCSWHSLCPRYTGEIPATYAGPS